MDGILVAGAVWSSTTHALRRASTTRAGAARSASRAARWRSATQSVGRLRRVGTARRRTSRTRPGWDHRHLGSIAVESSLVAAGVLAYARAARPRAWDVAPGVVLVQAAGHEVWMQGSDRWQRFAWFGERRQDWAQPMIFGDTDAITALRVGALAL